MSVCQATVSTQREDKAVADVDMWLSLATPPPPTIPSHPLLPSSWLEAQNGVCSRSVISSSEKDGKANLRRGAALGVNSAVSTGGRSVARHSREKLVKTAGNPHLLPLLTVDL